MADPADVPVFREISPTMRVDAFISDWKAEHSPDLNPEEQERELYGKAWTAYQDGDYGFGLWCWHEVDRLTNAFRGSVREVTRVLGPGRYFGFSHRRAVAEKVPIERLHRPRKGDMSTPRTDAFVLPAYQVLCVYAVRAKAGDKTAAALLEIALGELDERRRADAFTPHFETFRRLLDRPASPGVPVPAAPEAGAPSTSTSQPPVEGNATEVRSPPTKKKRSKSS